MSSRTSIALGTELQRRARAKADALGISFAEYMRRLIVQDLETAAPTYEEPQAKADISIFFDLIDEGPPTDIARDKDKMIGEAVWQEHLRETGQAYLAEPRTKRRRRRK